MPDREEDKARVRRKASQEAIALAMKSRWQEALVVNQNIIDNFPTDIDAFNRLGRAYTELREFAKAREAYSKTIELDPENSIAQKNLTAITLESGHSSSGINGSSYSPHIAYVYVGKAWGFSKNVCALIPSWMKLFL